MSKINVYSIKDTRANADGVPFFSQNDDTAKREFAIAVNGESMMGMYPEDFDLYLEGTVDSQAIRKKWCMLDSQVHVIKGIHLVEVDQQIPFEMTNGIKRTTEVVTPIKGSNR